MASKIYERKLNDNIRKGFRIHIEEYASAMDVADDCKKRTRTNNSFHDMPNERMENSWHGVSNYNEAIDLLHDGYEPQVTMVEIRKIADGEAKRISFVNNIVGSAPVVPLALCGVPNCMVDMRMKPIKTKVLNLYYDMTHSCSVSPEDLLEDGKKILGAIMAIERKGYRVNLYAVQTYTDSDDCDMLVVKVKSSDKPFDLKRMSFPLMHTAFFRVIGFDWYSKVPDGKYRFSYGHSLGREFGNKKVTKLFKEVFGDGAIYICDTMLENKTTDDLETMFSENNKEQN